jgi:hypothetical protein
VSTDPFVLPADGLWHHAVFFLDASHLTRVGSTTLTLSGLLGNVAELRILHATTPVLNGDPIVGQLGVDNVRASAIPEPAGAVLAFAGATALGLAARRRRGISPSPPAARGSRCRGRSAC